MKFFKKIIFLVFTFLIITFSPNVKASQGCCSSHFGENYCGSNGHIVCYDGWESPCICNSTNAKNYYESQKESTNRFVIILVVILIVFIMFIILKRNYKLEKRIQQSSDERKKYLDTVEQSDEYKLFINKVQEKKLPKNKKIISIFNFGKLNHQIAVWEDKEIFLVPISINTIIYDAFKKHLATDYFISNIKSIFVKDFNDTLKFAKHSKNLIEKKSLKDNIIPSDKLFEIYVFCKDNNTFFFTINYSTLVSLNSFYNVYTMNNQTECVKVFNQKGL